MMKHKNKTNQINKLSTPVKITALLGVTLIELLIVIAILAVLASIAMPSYQEYIKKADIVTAKADIIAIEQRIVRFYADNTRYPTDAAELGGLPTDPWGNPYVFQSFEGLNGAGRKRKDKNLVPINTDFDLYSMGPDGRTVAPLTAKHSRDDIIRANNGAFIGVAEDY